MSKRNLLLMAGLVALAVVAVAGWWLLSPLFIDKAVDEEFPRAARADIPPEMTRAEVGRVMTAMAKVDQPVMAEDMPQARAVAPQVVASGSFRDADSFHRGSGTATIYRAADGSHLLRLEEFVVTNGPDLRVLLAASPNPQSREELQAGGYVHLAKLKGNIGNQNYELPPEIDPTAQGSVIIYCMPFRVIFSVASLK